MAIPKPVLAAEKHAGSLLHPCSGLCFPSVARQLQKRHLLNFQIPRQNVFCLPVGRASLLHAGEAARTKGQQEGVSPTAPAWPRRGAFPLQVFGLSVGTGLPLIPPRSTASGFRGCFKSSTAFVRFVLELPPFCEACPQPQTPRAHAGGQHPCDTAASARPMARAHGAATSRTETKTCLRLPAPSPPPPRCKSSS